MKELISVIIPMYNSEHCIGKLMKCLKSQTYTNLEIIVVNDGSQDNSLNVVQEYANNDSRIKIISIENGGAGNARNVGKKHANGIYTIFLDSDDYIESDTLEKLLAKIIEENVSLLRFNYIKENSENHIVKEGNMYELANKIIDKDIIRNKLLIYLFEDKIPTYSTLLFAKTELIKSIDFRTDLNMMEDLIFCLNLYFKCDNIYFYDVKDYHYVYNEYSSTHNRKKLIINFNNTIQIIEELEKILNKEKIDKEIINKIYYIYSKIMIKFLVRTFEYEDEYKLSYEKFMELLSNNNVQKFINMANFNSIDNIDIIVNQIKNKEYKSLYEKLAKI